MIRLELPPDSSGAYMKQEWTPKGKRRESSLSSKSDLYAPYLSTITSQDVADPSPISEAFPIATEEEQPSAVRVNQRYHSYPTDYDHRKASGSTVQLETERKEWTTMDSPSTISFGVPEDHRQSFDDYAVDGFSAIAYSDIIPSRNGCEFPHIRCSYGNAVDGSLVYLLQSIMSALR